MTYLVPWGAVRRQSRRTSKSENEARIDGREEDLVVSHVGLEIARATDNLYCLFGRVTVQGHRYENDIMPDLRKRLVAPKSVRILLKIDQALRDLTYL
jgi:hypothetical protein